MAGFKTHIATSTALGIGYGAVGFSQLGLSAPTCILAGGLCSVSGMLPDLDSDSGVPVREMLAFAAAVVPMLLIERMETMGVPRETMALAAAGLYVSVRFGFGKIVKKFTTHRGMFHSIPAAAIAGLITFLVCKSQAIDDRYFKAGAVVVGFLSHLILDEIWSVQVKWGGVRFKSSSGTAIKFTSDSLSANLTTYALLAVLGFAAFQDAEVRGTANVPRPDRPRPIANGHAPDLWR